jgi:hypothetical protein
VARRVEHGKTIELAFADTDGFDPATFLPTFKRSQGRLVPTGGTLNTYDSVGTLRQSTNIALNGGQASAMTRPGANRFLGALSMFATDAILPKAAFAQTYDQASCASDGSMTLLDLVLTVSEGGLLGLAILVLDAAGMMECAGGEAHTLPTVFTTCPACPACRNITTVAWVCDWSGNSCTQEYHDEQYCPPC